MAIPMPMVVVKLPAWRRRLLLVLVLLGFVALLGRSLYLQSFHKRFLQEKGDARYNRTLVLPSQRGKITDRHGELLAISSPVESIWANPSDVKIDGNQTKKIADLLSLKLDVVNKKLANSEREFVYLKRRVSPELAAEVMRLGVPGVYLQREYKRYYPAGEVTAHLVGFTGIDDQGQEGFELTMNKTLSGKSGSRKVIKDRAGHIIEDLEAVKVPQDGHDVVLSIDRRIQYLAHRELAKAVDKFKAKAGAAIVLDAKTGEVLAMANVPTYNPNNPVNIQGKSRNRAITDTFEPGSTMKTVTAAAALESGLYQSETKIQTAPGRMTIGSATIHDAHAHGVLTVSEIIQKSSNIGSAKMALSLDKQYMWGVFNLIGFGTKTRIGFPGEASGRLRDFKTWRPIEQATMSYGHGISVTLLQLARAYTVFANDGELKPVSLLKLKEAPVGTQVFSPATAHAVKDMLELVVLPGGTALRAQVLGYRVAGKTGTTHKLSPQGGYEKDKYVGSFVGMAPASNPRLIMAVMIDDPSSGEYYGGTVAAPVFSAVMADTLRMLAIPQDAPNNNVVLSDDLPSGVDEVKESI
ncbi:MAG: cell division protein [Methylotenera sp. 24-45-7]|jgi:cell division protein FtsI (penicillin-binding protein 3)|nr:MAG: cell division protein [Methylotenera sp. 24-45-7]OZA09319.1 MAG: cell division protein [Methylotenera sp. 17-45-7]OZA53174.1 MAG: cell division protein [Methylophilales bacterium 39-45-7]HQS37065.1 penicillin-binding protein 2 [Methylotenera sp.]HQS43644.1 penicillin-binding protein 2 [Methylotenera sp.]